ncbi:MAG TPA: hypothetical protein DCQ26_15285 [Marinilabiliales bacterium]|jgi:hypothetical protein|nr:MAG: hypothetical protein A2W95_11025 [Bacteroidetes bacterium GWA2_40_14]OFX57137.1 MAG: hypothetical protein A2W84_14060 [Bacteroidetes bacterium GWC2_40_13]OFX73181.1 MAG: hypothetical protein A2W96_06980 [Bacteroidetes bacterium GWD2_40_43]OFX91736.1 MAG: hypothetical protein A2W97_07740 [Bacteroidetes bacterium GWE2_40_63]OFY24546.1 MAG: hypothetical protein A2W88_17160 [Bacteroidetes bacterium GWF2_40_13]OFZ23816.1 MAG: hypothetical protein A2437_10035 [Bacteroidetes bacterium RIFOXYC
MKTIAFLAIFVTIGMLTNAHVIQPKYVITETDTFFCEKLHVGVFKTKCVLYSGEKMVIPTGEVLSYSNFGKTMVKLPVYVKNKKTNKLQMMELVSYSHGIRIYKYEYYNGAKDCTDALFCFYDRNECILTQVNPDLAQIMNFLNKYQSESHELLTSE